MFLFAVTIVAVCVQSIKRAVITGDVDRMASEVTEALTVARSLYP